jgi:hypothetical protein
MTVVFRYLTDAHTHVSLLGLTRVWPLLQPGRFGHARSYDEDGHHLDVAVFMFWAKYPRPGRQSEFQSKRYYFFCRSLQY